MANILTPLIPTLYEGLQVVSREMVGFIPAVTLDTSLKGAALGQTVRVPLGAAGALEAIVPGPTPANSGSTTPGYVDISLNKSYAAPILWNGEEQLALTSNGDVYNVLLANQFADAVRKLVNAVEIDIYTAAKTNASRAYGTAGTTPLGTSGDLSDIAQIAKILDDNGAPTSDRQMVFNSAVMANLRGKQSMLLKVNEAGTANALRYGIFDPVLGFAIRNSAGITAHTKGTGASYVTSGATAVGGASITLATGSGTVLAGDVVTFAADEANKYVVKSGVSAPGAITLGQPGALAAIATGNAMTIGNSYMGSFGFTRSALVLAARPPAMPTMGDAADDYEPITDPVTGLSFQVAVYRQYRQVKFEVGLAWGVGAPNGAHIATLLG